MYSECCKDEVIVKLVGKLTLEFPDMDQLKVRNVVEETLYKYKVEPLETGLVVSDIEDKLQIYLATRKLDGLSQRTLSNYRYQLLIFSDYIKKPLATITTMDLRMFLAARCKEMRPSSVNAQISTLKAFFKWLADEEYIPKNPASKLKLTKEPKRLKQPLSDEEAELLKQACITDREKALTEFLISTGCRLSEVVEIDKSDIDWYEMSLNVIGKGDKERKVYFNTRAKILLKKYLSLRTDDNPALFVTEVKPFRRVSGRTVQKEVKDIAARVEVNKSISPHLFRHTFATHSINSGMPLHIIQHIMGHTSPATTQIYAKINDENVRHEYKKIS
ncbi:MAG: site-specific tyrosine recombinase/integron integrase [Clostridiaceae bacterium]